MTKTTVEKISRAAELLAMLERSYERSERRRSAAVEVMRKPIKVVRFLTLSNLV